jgi:hypothetical protein
MLRGSIEPTGRREVKDKVIDIVVERTGIDRAKAEEAVETVLGYLRDNPGDLKDLAGIEPAGPALRERVAPVAEKGKEALGEAREKIGPAAEKGKEALGEAREKLVPVAKEAGERLGDVGEKAASRLRGLFKRDKHEEDGADDSEAVPSVAAEAAEAAAATTERQ